MKSKAAFFIHFACFFLFVTSSLCSYEIKKQWPDFFGQAFFPGFMAVSVLTLASWPLFGGCPLTNLENRLRVREGKGPYQGSCMVHYFYRWTGRRPNKTFIHVLLVGVMAVPAAVRFFLE